MKKIISIFVIMIVSILLLQACCKCNDSDSVNASSDSMFISIPYSIVTDDYYVVYHKDTRVMYAISNGSGNRGIFTLLVNPDGSPMIYNGGNNNE